MVLLMACGTWIKTEEQRRVIKHLGACEIFPNAQMIREATGVSERVVRRTLGEVFAQERMFVSRIALFPELGGYDMAGVSREDILIRALLRRMMHAGMLMDHTDVEAFLERARFYDESGAIRCRFTAEQVRHALSLGPLPS